MLHAIDTLTMPAELRVSKNLSFLYTSIKNWTGKAHVQGNILLTGSDVERLPDGLVVDGEVFGAHGVSQVCSLRQTLTGPLTLSANPTAHHRLMLVSRLKAYPDVQKLWQINKQLILYPLGADPSGA